MKHLKPWLAAALALAALAGAGRAGAEERVIRITGFGATSGVLRPFGVNSEAALRAAADDINRAGGVKLGDGARGRIEIRYLDDNCKPTEGVDIVRRLAQADTLAAVGTTCSPVVQAVYGSLQKKAGDAADSGLQLPVFTDVAMKIGLAKMSDWSFRNIPDENAMYEDVFAWVRRTHPDARTVYGGVEQNFVHSNQTWYQVMKPRAQAAGFDVLGETRWLLDDTNFAEQVRAIKAANADVVAISAHPYSACGVLKEMQRQGVRPKVLVGLTSSSTPELLKVCGPAAEGLVIPTSFATINPDAQKAATETARYGGYADLHSMAAWEILTMIRAAIETRGVLAKPDTVQADREKIREGLAAMKTADGLLGPVKRTADRESIKPFVLVEARRNEWTVIERPAPRSELAGAAPTARQP
ncbi:ABC transporter substrate-binding protein [Burkholderia ubonensis]|uniref:ABC transporter substrate-binding protein n=2 Tax=Burkholderia ubonensis TaxID=101571 RepID=UPI000753C65B|nr:ABC transporter substrate-binding protein [Burkholderia ubonensis]KWC05628.1 ABC transporter substrate-binding protein [Burkholderia ubonensis]KWO73399.1 ABC transporter substrate-binding protein [Burkholderia ubonensis]OJB19765.1 ABC transporter substrate-binding protein [Burkholderia ubonensis]